MSVCPWHAIACVLACVCVRVCVCVRARMCVSRTIRRVLSRLLSHQVYVFECTVIQAQPENSSLPSKQQPPSNCLACCREYQKAANMLLPTVYVAANMLYQKAANMLYQQCVLLPTCCCQQCVLLPIVCVAANSVCCCQQCVLLPTVCVAANMLLPTVCVAANMLYQKELPTCCSVAAQNGLPDE